MRKLALTILVLLVIGAGFVLTGCQSGPLYRPIDYSESDKNSREIWFEFNASQLRIRYGDCSLMKIQEPFFVSPEFTGKYTILRNGRVLLSVDVDPKEPYEFLGLQSYPPTALIAYSGTNQLRFGKTLNFELHQNAIRIVINYSKQNEKKVKGCQLNIAQNIKRELLNRTKYESAHANVFGVNRKLGDIAPPVISSRPINPAQEIQPQLAQSQQDIKEADKLARERKLFEEERKKLEAAENRQRQALAEKEPPSHKEQLPQSGSGFFVSKMGHVITNAHVVQNCNRVTIGDNANKQVPAEIVNADKSNDLALLKLSTLEMASAESQFLIQKLGIVVVPLASKGLLRSEDVKLGEKVLVAGYPFGEFFSNTIKVTTGVVSATRGAGDDSGQFQLDAAVQPGNSGGPIYDSGGNIVGVVISQLDKLKMAKAIGSMPENVNFGIKASTVRQFLTSSGLPSKKSERTEEKSTEQLAEIARNQALMVMCLQ